MAQKKSVSAVLSTKLTGLQGIATKQGNVYNYGRELLYENLVDTYLWWRDARDEPGYLDKLYEDNGVKVNSSNSNKPNFTGVLKVIWQMSDKFQPTIARWNGAIGIIDDEYVDNKSKYRNDTKQRLVGFIKDNGGLTPLREKRGWQSDGESEPPKGNSKSKAGKDEVSNRVLVEEGIKFFKSKAKPIATIDTGYPLIATKDDLVAVIARRNKNGELEVLATTDDDEYVNPLAARLAVEDLSKAPSNISILVEAISIHSLPYKMRKLANALAEPSEYKLLTSDGKSFTPKKTVRLAIRPKHGDILVSLSRTNASVVTRIKPKSPLISSGNDLFLKGDLTGYIRRKYVYGKSLGYTSAKPSTRITKAGDEYVASHLIQTTITTKTNDERKDSVYNRNIYFYNTAKLFEEQRFQVDYNDDEKFVPLWTVDVTPNWWAQLQADFTSEWINWFAPNAKRNVNKLIEIKLTNSAWQSSWADKSFNKSYDEEGWERTKLTLFNSDCKVDVTGRSQVFKALSKDLITVFNAIYKQNISSRKIRIEGNVFGMRITYKTKLGDYMIYVPAAERNFKRDETYFKRYEYV
jgi:hypothetical protein